MVISRGRTSDLETLLDLYDAFDRAHQAQGVPPLEAGRLEEWLSTLLDDGVNFMADLDGRAVGHSFYVPASAPEPELAVFVHPDYHGRGIGTELCEHLVATGESTGRDAIVLEVERHNRVAVRIYRRLGFETVHDGRELFMRLPLDDAEGR